MRVERLSRGGWVDLGDYREDRARELVDGLRREGEVVRMEGEPLPRPRIGWEYEDKTGALVGSINDVSLFVVVPPPARQRGPAAIWVMHVLLPGYQNLNYELPGQLETIDTAELILDRFQWRIGVRGWRNPQEAIDQGDAPTQLLPKMDPQ